MGLVLAAAAGCVTGAVFAYDQDQGYSWTSDDQRSYEDIMISIFQSALEG